MVGDCVQRIKHCLKEMSNNNYLDKVYTFRNIQIEMWANASAGAETLNIGKGRLDDERQKSKTLVK